MLPNFTSLSLTRPKASAPTAGFAVLEDDEVEARGEDDDEVEGGKAIFDPIDHAPLFKNRDANDKEEATFCVKGRDRIDDNGKGWPCEWYRAEGLAKWIGGQLAKGLPPNDPKTLQRLSNDDIQQLYKAYPEKFAGVPERKLEEYGLQPPAPATGWMWGRIAPGVAEHEIVNPMIRLPRPFGEEHRLSNAIRRYLAQMKYDARVRAQDAGDGSLEDVEYRKIVRFREGIYSDDIFRMLSTLDAHDDTIPVSLENGELRQVVWSMFLREMAQRGYDGGAYMEALGLILNHPDMNPNNRSLSEAGTLYANGTFIFEVALYPNATWIMNSLVVAGWDVNQLFAFRGFAPTTVLHIAAAAMNAEAVVFLLNRGADPTRRNNNMSGATPLVWCLKFFYQTSAPDDVLRHEEVVRALATSDTVNLGEYDGETPLMIASRSSSANAIRVLTTRGADVNARDSDGWTPLHFASQRLSNAAGVSRVDVVEALLLAGADPTIESNDGRTAGDLATDSRVRDMSEFFAGFFGKTNDSADLVRGRRFAEQMQLRRPS